ncbi:MAG TPA: hypothetical protein PLW65_02025 [Pseudomonadota bacterium]|nr:hypothetical protein [Pseudomonadota bacterium]
MYRDLIKFCCSSASKMLLVVRDPEQEPGAEIRGVLSRLNPFLLESVRTNTWPGTILLTDQAMVYSYRASDDLGALLSELVASLFGWLHPSAPEDLCFCRGDGQPLLVTTAHEQDAYLLLTASEYAALGRRFPSLAAMLRKE